MPRPRLVEAQCGAVARIRSEQPRDVGIIPRRHLRDVGGRDAELLRRDHREDGPAENVEQIDVLFAYELRERFPRDPIREDAKAAWILHRTPHRGELGHVGAQCLTSSFRQRTSTSRPVRDSDLVEREYSGYFKDDFKVTPSFTLNLGVRYEWYSVPYNGLGRSAAPVGQCAAGPVGRKLSFCDPNLSAMRRSGPNSSRAMESTRSYQAAVLPTSAQLRTT